MLPPEIASQIRRLQFRARRAVDDLVGGEYHSVFKGPGIIFEEVREYQPGDDVRAIDWNVTARMGNPFVKRYVEERELTVMLAMDWSASQEFGTRRQHKREVAAELVAVLAVSAAVNNDKVGLVGFTDAVECYVPPDKGGRHVLRLIREALCYRPARRGTSLASGLTFLSKVLRRRAVVFVLSDFHDHGYEAVLKRVGHRHDLILVRLTDPAEESLPALGLLELEDVESGRRLVIDTNSPRTRQRLAERVQHRTQAFRRLVRAARADLLEVNTEGGHLEALVRYFKGRERRLKRLS
jgi:uncharacterized protein (DUF58 family)